MTNSGNTSAILNAGMFYLKEKLGVIDTEVFITAIRSDRFDYTEWRKENLFKGMSAKEINEAAAEFCDKNHRPPLKNEKLI